MSEPEQKINFVNVILSLPLHPSIPPSLHPSIPPDITTMSANVQQVASGLVTAYEHALKLLTDGKHSFALPPALRCPHSIPRAPVVRACSFLYSHCHGYTGCVSLLAREASGSYEGYGGLGAEELRNSSIQVR